MWKNAVVALIRSNHITYLDWLGKAKNNYRHDSLFPGRESKPNIFVKRQSANEPTAESRWPKLYFLISSDINQKLQWKFTNKEGSFVLKHGTG
jgi:hypothetical protein